MLYDFPSTPVILLFVSRFYLHERISAVRLPSEKCPLNAVAVPWFPYCSYLSFATIFKILGNSNIAKDSFLPEP